MKIELDELKLTYLKEGLDAVEAECLYNDKDLDMLHELYNNLEKLSQEISESHTKAFIISGKGN